MSVFSYTLVCFLIIVVRERKGFACTCCKREKQQPQNWYVLHQKPWGLGVLVVKYFGEKTPLYFFVLANLLGRRCWGLKSLLDQLKGDSEV